MRCFTLVIPVAMVLSHAVSLSAEEAAANSPPPAFEPTSNYELVDVEGWQVYIHKPLLAAESELGLRAQRLLRLQLQQIATLVPPTPLAKLRTVRIWLDDDPHNKIHYHPERQWLVDNGYNPERAQCVDIGDAQRFLEYYRDQPFVLLHELSHAYHDQVLGFEDERITLAHAQAVSSGTYAEVLKISGGTQPHYSLTDHKEYFAESTEAFFGTNDFFPFVRAELRRHDPRMFRLLEEVWLADVTPPPPAVVERLHLAAFYKQHVDASGFSILSSEKVAPAALLEAAYLLNRMLDGRDDIRQALIDSGTRFVVMGAGEFTTEIPEHSDLEPKNYWDRRARGLGATRVRPAVSCGEENLLGLRGDPYHAENILVHEFAHAIHDMGLKSLDETFDPRLQAAYQQAQREELWKGKYASTNHHEYWAEGVQSYFGTNRPPDHDHNHVDTRDELREYDPRLFALIDEVFQGNVWQYKRPAARLHEAHLRGLDIASLPTFSWPERLSEENAKLEQMKRRKRQDDQ